MEKFRSIQIKDTLKKAGAFAVDKLKEFDAGMQWDLWEDRKPLRFPIPTDVDLEAEKERIIHTEDCGIGNIRVKLLETFQSVMVASGYSMNVVPERRIHLECQFCDGRGPDLLKRSHLPISKKMLESLAIKERDKARAEWIKKMKGEL